MRRVIIVNAWSQAHGISFLPVKELLSGVEEGTLSVHLDKVFKLEEIQEAHKYTETSKAIGKVVCLVGEDEPVGPLPS